MTLLITAATPEFALCCSDMRISYRAGAKYVTADEKFNKHIVFHSAGLTADITFTGVAQWQRAGKTIRLYDVISDSVGRAAKKNLAFGPLLLELMADLTAGGNRVVIDENGIVPFEIHIAGYHREIPLPWLAVVSTTKTAPPWRSKGELEWDKSFPGLGIYFKAVEQAEVVIGGMTTAVNNADINRLYIALQRGADAFNIANLAARIIAEASNRHSSVGERSVSVVMPRAGVLDTNLWERTADGIKGFMPRIVFNNGTTWGPSEFPVSLQLLSTGHLPKHSLFFKSIAYKWSPRRVWRKVFARKKGKPNPGLFGLIGLALFGKVVEGFDDFGLAEDSPWKPKD